jgi:hypothetical protein
MGRIKDKYRMYSAAFCLNNNQLNKFQWWAGFALFCLINTKDRKRDHGEHTEK